jgi:hypothetical protein
MKIDDRLEEAAKRVVSLTARVLRDQGAFFETEKQLDACIEQCHKEALGLIRDPKLRFQVAKVLSYKGIAGDPQQNN